MEEKADQELRCSDSDPHINEIKKQFVKPLLKKTEVSDGYGRCSCPECIFYSACHQPIMFDSQFTKAQICFWREMQRIGLGHR